MADGPITRWPWYLVQAVQRGLQVASWMEHLPTEDQPPENIWHHSERLKEWFDRIKAGRDSRHSSRPDDEWETVPGSQTVDFDHGEELRELRGY